MAWGLRKLPYILLVLTLVIGLWGCAAQTAQTPTAEASKAAAEPLITKIEAKKDGAKVRVAIVANQPMRYKTIFKANNPTRLVVDLQGYKFMGIPAQQPVNLGAVESIGVEAVEEGVRKVARININLNQVVAYDSSNGGEVLLIDFDLPTTAAPATPADKETVAAAAPAAVEPPARKITSEAKAAEPPAEPQTPTAAPEPAKKKAAAKKPAANGELVVISSFEVKNAAKEATVIIGADGPMGAYQSFQLPNPARLVVDIPNATHAAPKQVAVKETGLVTRLRSAQYKDAPKKIVRVVVELKEHQVPYKIETMDNQLVVLLGETAIAKGASAVTAQAVSTGKPGPVRDIIKIDFKPVDKKSRVTITASGQGELKYNINRLEDPPSLVLDLMDAKLAASAKKTLDLRELPSAIAQIRAVQHQKEPQSIVRVVMDLKGWADYKILPAAKGITIEVAQVEPGKAPAAAAPRMLMPTVAGAAPAINGEQPLVSFDFKEADIGNVLRTLSEVGKVSIVVSEEVKAKVTVRLESVPWEKALGMILKANNLAYVKEDNVIRVAKADTLKREEEDRLKSRTMRDELIPLVTRTHSLNYAKATDMAKSLKQIMTKRGEAQVDERTNTLIIKDIPEKVEEVIKLVTKLDTRTPQVMIEARIVEVTSPDFEREIGIQWGFQFRDRYQRSEGGRPGRFPREVTGFGDSADSRGGTTPFIVNVPVSQLGAGGAGPAGAIGLTLARAVGLDTAQLDLRIQAHERLGDLKVISSPKITVLDNVEAEVQSGASIPVQVVEQGEVSTKYIDANIDLKVTPRITVDNNIRLQVSAKKNEPDFTRTVNGNPVINKREARTEVLVKDGETIVIGGVFKGTDNRSEDRVPWLGSIPLLGWAFKKQFIQQKNEELLIFITPQILKGV